MPEIAEARPASTVVLLRDTPRGMETLLLKRNKAVKFAGGLWVFPGGALEPKDMEEAGGDIAKAACLAAAREAEEECGLRPDIDSMVQLSHWTTPIVEPKRFKTWIYAAPLASEERVIIDGSEIHEAMWINIQDALDQHKDGDLGMMPPTFVTLASLAVYENIAAMLGQQRDMVPPEVQPVLTYEDGGPALLFAGDAGYEAGDSTIPGARHRTILEDKNWIYLHSDVDKNYPAFINPAR
jgi:8-oxo-dGTP pyrophosphatase MutT (NUDIX family)